MSARRPGACHYPGLAPHCSLAGPCKSSGERVGPNDLRFQILMRCNGRDIRSLPCRIISGTKFFGVLFYVPKLTLKQINFCQSDHMVEDDFSKAT